MDSGAAGILLELHGSALREVSRSLGVHFEGLGAAARAAHKGGLISGGLKKRMLQLDMTCAWVRHITEPRASSFMAQLKEELNCAAPALFEGSDDSDGPDSVISSNAAISACKQGPVLMCPQVLHLPNPPELISSNAAISDVSEKGMISYNAAISLQGGKGSTLCEKGVRDSVDDSEISYSAAITTDVFATPEKKVGGEERFDELFTTPPTKSTVVPLSATSQAPSCDDDEDEIIAHFLDERSAIPCFPNLAAINEKGCTVANPPVISYSAAISASAKDDCAHGGAEISSSSAICSIETGLCASTGAVISCSAAISADEKKGSCTGAGAKISYNVAISGCEKGPHSAALISSNSAISAGSENAVDVGSLTESAEHFAIASNSGDAASDAYAALEIELDQSISECRDRAGPPVALTPFDEVPVEESDGDDEPFLFVGLCVITTGLEDQMEMVLTGERDGQHMILRVHPDFAEAKFAETIARLYVGRSSIKAFAIEVRRMTNGMALDGRLYKVVALSGLDLDGELWLHKQRMIADTQWSS